MAVDARGNSHKAAGRPDGGQFDGKAGGGSDDDLEVPTTAAAVEPDEGWWKSLESISEATAGPKEEMSSAPSDDGRWRDEDKRTPELEAMRKAVMDARDRKEAEAILTDLPELARCAVIRSLPFAYKAAVADLTPDPDEQSDLATMVAGLPYSSDDAKRGALLGWANRGDVRAAAALAVYGGEMDLKWLSGKSVAKRPSVAAALKNRGVESSEAQVLIESLGRVAEALETGTVEVERPMPKTESDKAETPTPEAKPESKKSSPKPADLIADMAERATHATNLWEARKLVSTQPKKTRVAVIRAMPFSRRAQMADLAGDPDKARGYQSLLDMLPYTEDSPTDRLLDMANRGDVRAAAALAAYGGDAERRELKKLPVADHRAVMMALAEHEPKVRRHAPPATPAAPKPPSRLMPAPGASKAPPTPSKPRYASNRAQRYSRPRRRTFRERMASGIAGLKTIWSGVWAKWAAVFRGRPSRP